MHRYISSIRLFTINLVETEIKKQGTTSNRINHVVCAEAATYFDRLPAVQPTTLWVRMILLLSKYLDIKTVFDNFRTRRQQKTLFGATPAYLTDVCSVYTENNTHLRAPDYIRKAGSYLLIYHPQTSRNFRSLTQTTSLKIYFHHLILSRPVQRFCHTLVKSHRMKMSNRPITSTITFS